MRGTSPFVSRVVATVSSSSSLPLLLLFALCVLAMSASPARADDTLGCEMLWSGPSPSNDVVACILNSGRWRQKSSTLVLPALSIVLGAIILLGLPWCWCLPLCRRLMTPRSADGAARARLWLYMWVLFALLWSIGVCVLLALGTNTLNNTLHAIVGSVTNMTTLYLKPATRNITELVSDPKHYAPDGMSVDLTQMTSMVNQVDDMIASSTSPIYYYASIARGVLVAFGAVLVVLCVLLIIVACCRCARIIPVTLSVVFFVLGLVFAVLSVIVTAVMPLTQQTCNELDRQRDRMPGLMQWYVVPKCNDAFGLPELHKTVSSQTLQAAYNGCGQLSNYCENSSTYRLEDPNRIFTCNMSGAADCMTLDNVVTVVHGSAVKDDLVTTMCREDRPADYTLCNMSTCALYCHNFESANLMVRDRATELVNMMSFVENVTIAVAIATQFLDCNYIADLVVGPLVGVQSNPAVGNVGEPTPQICVDFASSTIMAGAGCFVAIWVCIVAFVVLMRGRVVWGNIPYDK